MNRCRSLRWNYLFLGVFVDMTTSRMKIKLLRGRKGAECYTEREKSVNCIRQIFVHFIREVGINFFNHVGVRVANMLRDDIRCVTLLNHQT